MSQSQENQVYEFAAGSIQLMWKGYFFVRMNDHSISTIESVKESHDIMQRLKPEGEVYILVHAGIGSDSEDEIFEYVMNSDFNKRVKGQAILVKDLATRLMGNLFLRYLRNQRQIKMFTAYNSAESWLLQQMGKNGGVTDKPKNLMLSY